MENRFKSTYNKIQINEGRKTEIEAVIGKTKNKGKVWTGTLAAVAAALVVLMIIPATRSPFSLMGTSVYFN